MNNAFPEQTVVVLDPKDRQTSDYASLYEINQMLRYRAEFLDKNPHAERFTLPAEQDNYRQAAKELAHGTLPHIVVREHNNGTVEQWKASELKISKKHRDIFKIYK